MKVPLLSPRGSWHSIRDANRDRRFGDFATAGSTFLRLSASFGFDAAGGAPFLFFFDFFLAALICGPGSGSPLRTRPMRCIAMQNSWVGTTRESRKKRSCVNIFHVCHEAWHDHRIRGEEYVWRHYHILAHLLVSCVCRMYLRRGLPVVFYW